MSEIKVNLVTPRSGTTVTLGEAGDTIALGACASATGFGITGITWCTTAKTGAFCAAVGSGYLVNTTSTAFTATLPTSPTVGDQISFVDFAGTFDCNALTLGRNSKKIKGSCCDATVTADRGAVTIIYTGTTQGWITTSQANDGAMVQAQFVAATGGSPSTGAISGDYKIHSFTGTGPLCVSNAGNAGGSNRIDYMVVAGGGGGGGKFGGGGGAGGYRESVPSPAAWTASPLADACSEVITAAVSDYTITVGGGGASPGAPPLLYVGCQGGSSIFSTITSVGGGGGGGEAVHPSPALGAGAAGGSGGGGGAALNPGGAGNTPPTTPPQGNTGGTSAADPPGGAGGGGGATAVGANAAPGVGTAGAGGAGATTCISASPTTYGGGGGGGATNRTPAAGPGPGGTGGGGAGAINNSSIGTAGTANTGGGGGGGFGYPTAGGPGGSGIVIVRYKFQ